MTAWQAPHAELEEQTIADLRAAMAGGALTSRRLVEVYLERIQALDTSGPTLRAVIEVNPDALAIAEALDQERAAHGPRGPLHGIPILLKDNIDTADKMETTAGSLALVGVRRAQDAYVAARLVSPTVGLMPTTPLIEAGQRIEPSVSVPTETAQRLAATAVAEPELEPHGERSSA